MPTNEGYFEYVKEMLAGTGGVAYRKMMGEYLIYYCGKVVGGVYDNRFLLKHTVAAKRFLPNAAVTLPYEGAKPMLEVQDCRNAAGADFWQALFDAMFTELK